MPNDPVSGPITREKLRELVAAPFGAATKAIQEIDPLYGRKEGEKFRWKITADCSMRGTAYVEAASQDEADNLADDLQDAAFDWDAGWGSDISILTVEPDKR